MSKCGKGCMPECEYFTTGGCISPFNCMYRIEELSPNSATSVSSSYVQNLISENAALKSENARLTVENASLRKRLENAVEFPRSEVSPYDNNDTLLYYLENGHIQQECFNNKHLEQLQKRLAELKGDMQ